MFSKSLKYWYVEVSVLNCIALCHIVTALLVIYNSTKYQHTEDTQRMP